MSPQIPSWLLNTGHTAQNMVDDSPEFRQGEQKQQANNMLKATKTAMNEVEQASKEQQLKDIQMQMTQMKTVQAQHKQLLEHNKQMEAQQKKQQEQQPDFSGQTMSGPATSAPPKDPQTLPGPGDEPHGPPPADQQQPMHGMQQMPYSPGSQPSDPGAIPSNSTTPGTSGPPQYMAPPDSSPTVSPMNDNQKMAEGNPAEDVQMLAHATGLPTQVVASMALLGKQLGDTSQGNSSPLPPTA